VIKKALLRNGEFNPLSPDLLGLFLFVFVAKSIPGIVLQSNRTIFGYANYLFIAWWFATVVAARTLVLSKRRLSASVVIYLFYVMMSAVAFSFENAFYGMKAFLNALMGALLYYMTHRVLKNATLSELVGPIRQLNSAILLLLIAWLAKSGFEETSVAARLTTETMSFNVAGFYALLGIVTSVILARSVPGLYLPSIAAIGLGAVVLFYGLNKNSIVVAIGFQFLYLAEVKLSMRGAILSLLAVSLSIFVFTILRSPLGEYFETQRGLESLISLTGRTSLWSDGLAEIDGPVGFLIGRGYGSAEVLFQRDDLFSVNYVHFHNAVLQSIYETGVIGAILLHYFVLYNVVKGAQCVARYGKKEASINVFFWISVAIVIRGITEPSYAQVGSFEFFFALIANAFFRRYAPARQVKLRC
jgi:O-antigen ligase